MIKHRSGFLGLVLSLAVLSAACEDKTEVIIPPNVDPVAVNVVPDALTLEVGQTGQLIATVTGGDANTARTVTWASSNNNVATVNASGVVTAVSNGVATITATATADANARDASAITVQPGAAPPSLSIKSITAFSTTIPVALNNVFGQIDVTLNLDAPPGSQISTLNTYVVNGTEETLMCTQEFSSAAVAALVGDEAQGEAEIICSIPTNAFTGEPGVDPEADVTFENGQGYRIKAEIVGPQGTITANVQSALMTFNNTNFIFTEMTSPTHCVNSATTGLVWCEGDVKAELLPVMFTNATVSSITLTSSTGATATDATASDGFNITLQKATTPAPSSVATVENANVTFQVTSLTSGGQPGPRCINPDPVLNPQPACGTTANLNAWVMAAPFRLDNVAPVVTRFDLTPGGGLPNPADSIGLGCNPTFPTPASPNACYVNEVFGFNTTQTVQQTVAGPTTTLVPFFVMTDGGVGSPTATFMAGPAGTLSTVTTGGDLAESVTSNAYVAQAVTMDALENTRTVYAGPNGLAQTSVTGAQTFGVDTTAPSSGPTAGLANNSTNPAVVAPAWTVGPAIDAGVGPSGFLPNPFRVIVQRHLPAGVTCFTPANVWASTNTTACTTSAGAPIYQVDDGLVDVPVGLPPAAGTEGYWHLIVHAIDAAWPGNRSADSTRTTLLDVTAPVVGGISAPASLPGGQAAAFTAPLVDNVDLRRLDPFLTYAGGTIFQWPSVTLGAYGFSDGLVGAATGTFNVANFVRSIEGTTAAGRANTTPNAATTVTFDVYDVALNLTSAALGITPAVVFGAGGIIPALGTAATGTAAVDSATFNPTNALHGNFLHLAPSNPTVCSDPATATCTSPRSTLVSATMTGPNATFANPFTAVQFYYQDPVNSRWYLIGTGTPAASDNTVTSTRTWTYSFTWTVSGALDSTGAQLLGALPIVAVGIHASGSAIISTGTAQNVTLVSD